MYILTTSFYYFSAQTPISLWILPHPPWCWTLIRYRTHCLMKLVHFLTDIGTATIQFFLHMFMCIVHVVIDNLWFKYFPFIF